MVVFVIKYVIMSYLIGYKETETYTVKRFGKLLNGECCNNN